MNAGRIEHLGTPEDVYLRPKTLFTAGFIGQANLLPGTVESVDGSGFSVTLSDGSLLRAMSAADACSAGSGATVMIRPGHLKLDLERPAAATSAFPVRLTDETFQGSWARYAAETRSGARIVILVPSDARPGPEAFQDDVWVSCSAEHVYVLAQEENP